MYSTCEFPNPGRRPSPRPHHSFDLARVNVDGSQVTRLTDSRRFESLPVWSPDGTRVAFVAGMQLYPKSRSLVRLHIMTPDGDDVRVVETGIAAFHPPSWSPDGKRLAFVALEREHHRDTYDYYGRLEFSRYVIYSVAADGSDPQRLAQTVSGPSWSPDGTRIAFAKPFGKRAMLVTMAADGTDVRHVASIDTWVPLEGEEDDPARGWVPTVAWSPTGEYILIGDARDVYVVRLDGVEVGRLPIRFYFENGPIAAWSPDGSRIAIAAPVGIDDSVNESSFVDGEAWHTLAFEVVYTMAPDGTDVVSLVRAKGRGGDLVAVQSERYRAASVTKACGAGLVVEKPSANPGLVQDCETLAGLRDAFFGRHVVNWTADTPLRDWVGVIVEGTPPRVTGLVLMPAYHSYTYDELDNGNPPADGILPPALGALSELKTLDLPGHWLEGPIPPELGRLSKLEHLDLSSDPDTLNRNALGLWGEIPRELGNLARLRVLNLASNSFSVGPIPPWLGGLTELQLLNLSENLFERSIPAALGQLSNLTVLDLSDNLLSGAVPAELGQLDNLKELDLSRNRQLTGCIPAGLPERHGARLPTCEPSA